MHKKLFVSLVAFVAIVLNAFAVSAQSIPLLGSAQNFGVLGASTVTNTGPSLVTGSVVTGSEGTGDVGVSPGIEIATTTARTAIATKRSTWDGPRPALHGAVASAHAVGDKRN